MSNVIDYLKWRGDIRINKDNINEVDMVIFSLLSYLDLETIPSYPSKDKVILTDALKKLFEIKPKNKIVMGLIVPQQIVDLAFMLKDMNRYAIECSNYVNIIDTKMHMQFSAVCFHVDDIVIVTFRGTDDTLIGWQENLDMIVNFPTNGEKEAVNYLNEIAKTYYNSNIIVTGHSKGGNLATYASICCNDYIKNRIIGSYDLDGPGFDGKFNETSYNLIKDKLHKYLPKESIIGMLLEEICPDINVLKCNKHGIYQHDAFTWNVIGPKLIRADELSNKAIKIDTAITNMVLKLSEEERYDLANDFYMVIKSSNIKTLMECQKNRLALLKSISNMDVKNKRIFVELVFNILKYGGI